MRKTLLLLSLLLGLLAPAAAQTVNLFDSSAVQSGGPYEGSGALDNYGFKHELVPARGYLSIVPNWTVGANGPPDPNPANASPFRIVFFASDRATVLGSTQPVSAGTCITAPSGTAYYGVSWNPVNYPGYGVAMINDGCRVAGAFIAYVAPPKPSATINFPSQGDKAYNAAPFQLMATSNSTGALTYSLQYGPATVSSSGLITLTGANGTVGVMVSQAADANYAASTASLSFQVTGAPQPLTPLTTIAAISNHLYTSPAFAVSGTTNSGSPITYSISSGPATISGSSVRLTGANGTVFVTASTAANAQYLAGSATTSFAVYGAPVVGPLPGYTTVTGQHTGGDADLVSNATIVWTPVADAGQRISFKIGGNGGPALVKPYTAQVSNGQFSILVPDSCLTSPKNVSYKVQIIDNMTGQNLLGAGYDKVQPCGDTWSLDTYNSYLPSMALVTPGAPGESAYQLAVDNGFSGTVTQWIASLQGPAGGPGQRGVDGQAGPAGALNQTGTAGGLNVNGPLTVNEFSRASLWGALHNAIDDPQAQGRTQYACILNISDSILNGTGPTETADQPLNQLARGLSAYPSGGFGLLPIIGYPGVSSLTWQFAANSGTFTTSHEFGPYQLVGGSNGQAIDSLLVGTGNAVATLYSPNSAGMHYGGKQFKFLGVIEPGDTGWTISVDNTVVGTGVCADPGSAQNPTYTSSLCQQAFSVASALDHNVSITPTAGGRGHAYGVEWISNDHGVLIENMGHGTARSDGYGSDVAHQLAFISQLSCTPDAAIVEFGTNDVLQGINTAAQYTTYMQNIATYLRTNVNPNISIYVLDGPAVNYPGNGMTEAAEHDAQLNFSQSIGAYFGSLKDDWGSYDRANALGFNSGDHIHPSDKGTRYIGYKLSHWILN